MIQRRARKISNGTPRMHAGSRFGDVVEGLVGVRAEDLHAHMAHRANATGTTGWLEGLVARCSKDLVVWRKEAFGAVERALAADERTRSQPESVVTPEQL